jgi:transposase
LDRDLNAAQNILLKATAGTAGSNAWGEAEIVVSLNQEASSVRARYSPLLRDDKWGKII